MTDKVYNQLMDENSKLNDCIRTWETTMMQAIGEDGPKSVAQAIEKLKEQNENMRSLVSELAEALKKTTNDFNETRELEFSKTEPYENTEQNYDLIKKADDLPPHHILP